MKISELDKLHWGEIEKYKKKLGEMEVILDEKNHNIIKLRTNCGVGQIVQGNAEKKDTQFYFELVEVLKKKLLDRDERLNRLEAELNSQKK